jgi:hypothetical protein
MKTTGLTASEETTLRYIVGTSACLSLFGCGVIVYSALRFKELSKRFFAIRLIFFLTVADASAALFNMIGAFVDVPALQKRGTPSVLCEVQAAGLLYFNLASIMWTSCFAFTLYRDLVPSSFGVGTGRTSLRTYESYYHALCWPVPAVLAGTAAALGYLGDSGPWCALGPAYSREYLLCFYLPLMCAFAFNIIVYALVRRHSRERRVSRTTSLYLLGFVIVWFPSLLRRLQVSYMKRSAAGYLLAVGEAVCMPLQGALNAAVYGWSLPSIRDVYRFMLLGTDSLEAADEARNQKQVPSPAESADSYTPPGAMEVSTKMELGMNSQQSSPLAHPKTTS